MVAKSPGCMPGTGSSRVRSRAAPAGTAADSIGCVATWPCSSAAHFASQ